MLSGPGYAGGAGGVAGRVAGGHAADPDRPAARPRPPLRSVRIRVGGVTLRLRTPGGRALRLPRELRAFTVARGRDIDLEVHRGPLPPLPATAPLFVSGGLWAAYGGRHGDLVYVVREPRRGRAALALLEIDRARRRGRLFVPPGAPLVLHYPLDELLFQHHLAHHGGMEVHACGIGWRGRALLFCGVSGAGKTTTAGLWRRWLPEADVLSDDRIVVRERGGRPWAFGTPWHGSGRFASPRALPLGGLFFLARGRTPSLVPVGGAAAAAELFARSFPPPWEPPAVRRVLGLCARVTARVPSARFRFRPDASAVAAVLEAVRVGAG